MPAQASDSPPGSSSFGSAAVGEKDDDTLTTQAHLGAPETPPSPGRRVTIGLTFGNTNSSIAYTTDDKPEVIANEDGDRQIPTVLSYVDGEEYYGTQAKSFLVRNPSNSIAYFRDFLGQEFKSIDPTSCHASAHPHEVDGVVLFKVKEHVDEEADELSALSVSEVTTRYLRRLVRSASEYLGKTVTSAAVAVPTNFSDRQREVLVKAAEAANLQILQLISDPAAALLAHDARPEAVVRDKTIAVVDLGGTRSDVSIIVSRGGMYTILATAHDYEYAGVQLDQVLVDHFAKEFIKKHTTDPRSNPRSLAKLKLEAEMTKKSLSLGSNASFSVEGLADGHDHSSTINRLRFEMIARKVFDGFNRLVEGAVKKAGLDLLDIDEVLLSGGTAHVPRIAQNLRTIFPPSTNIIAPATDPNAINPSELQARGAALQASLIDQFEAEDIEQSVHPAVTTVSHTAKAIGVATVGADGREDLALIMATDTAVPARRTVVLRAPVDGGDVLIKVVEGGAHIKVTKPASKSKADKADHSAEDAADDDENDDENDDDGEEDEALELREKVWTVGNVLAETALRATQRGGQIEVTVNVLANLDTTITAREMGAKGGVRGTVHRP